MNSAALVIALAAANASHDVNVIVAPPCLATFRASGRAGNIATEQAKKVGAKTATRAMGQVGLFDGNVVVLPDLASPNVDAAAPSMLLGDDVTRTVVADHLSALKSPEEIVFAMPGSPVGFLDGILAAGNVRGHSPDFEKIEVRLVRLEKDGKRALAVELADAPRAHDALAYDRTFVGLVDVDTPSGKATIVSAILTIGGPARLKPALDDARKKAAGALTVMPGFVAGYPPRFDECMTNVKAAHVDVVVPGAADFVRAPAQAVAAWNGTGAVTLAANLDVRLGSELIEDVHLYRRTRILEREVDGKKVALIGLVDPAALSTVPQAVRAQWIVEDPIAAVYDIIEKAIEEPQPPDYIVVVTASRDLVQKLALVPDVDVVLAGADGRTDALDTVTRVDVRNTPREKTREPAPMYAALASTVAVRTVTAHFDDDKLTGVVDEGAPTTGWSARDMAFAKNVRVAEERDFVIDAPLLLPRLDDVLAAAPASAPPAKGTDIAYRGQFSTVAATDSPIWSDALFHRLVANILRHAFHADAAFTSTTPRRSDLGNAAVARRFVKDWLAGKGNVRVVDLKGADLLRLADAVNRQAQTQPSPMSWIYASGVDVAKGVVGGRKIDPGVTYHVVLDDKAADRVDVAAVLAGSPAHFTFVAPDVVDDSYDGTEPPRRFEVADEGGKPVAADNLVLIALTSDHAMTSGAPDAAKIGAYLADESAVLSPEWRFSVDGVDVHGTGARSSDGLAQTFGATHEARAVQPAFAQAGAHAKIGLSYDQALFAWESKLNVQYESILLTDIPNAAFLDQTDDLVLTTEGRLNSVSLSGGVGEFRVVPFLQLAGDSELTPVLVPVDVADPTKGYIPLDRQFLFRESLGAAAYPGGIFKEVRAGLLVQHDATAAFAGKGPITNDVGVGAESHIVVPFWKLVFTSDIDARYFIPDADDTDKDLGLRSQLVHKLAMPVTSTASVFLFVDALVLFGKTPNTTKSVGWNAIAGAGITFADLWRL